MGQMALISFRAVISLGCTGSLDPKPGMHEGDPRKGESLPHFSPKLFTRYIPGTNESDEDMLLQ